MYRYSQEDLAKAVKESTSVSQVMRSLGMRVAGGSHSHLTKRIAKEGLDTSHFLGQSSRRGVVSRARIPASEILIKRSSGSRTKTHKLKRAMLEVGIDYCCSECALISWQGKEITLDIDHIDGNWLDDRVENIRFMCPNCHSQTPTHGNKRALVVERYTRNA